MSENEKSTEYLSRAYIRFSIETTCVLTAGMVKEYKSVEDFFTQFGESLAMDIAELVGKIPGVRHEVFLYRSPQKENKKNKYVFQFGCTSFCHFTPRDIRQKKGCDSFKPRDKAVARCAKELEDRFRACLEPDYPLKQFTIFAVRRRRYIIDIAYYFTMVAEHRFTRDEIRDAGGVEPALRDFGETLLENGFMEVAPVFLDRRPKRKNGNNRYEYRYSFFMKGTTFGEEDIEGLYWTDDGSLDMGLDGIEPTDRALSDLRTEMMEYLASCYVFGEVKEIRDVKTDWGFMNLFVDLIDPPAPGK